MTAIRRVHVRVPFRAPFATAAGAWTARDSWILVLEEADGRCGAGEAVSGEPASEEAALEAARRDLAGGGGAWRHSWVGVNATIGALGVDEAVAAAVGAGAGGFRTLKLKTGSRETPALLAERLAAVRAAVGGGVALRLDANGTWDLAEAIERLRAVEPVGLQYVEQPLPPDDVEAMAALRRRVTVPIAADEAVTSPAAARTLLDAAAVDVLVAKPARVGGPGAVAAIAALAAERGVPVVVSSLFETGVGLAAALASAAALPGVDGWPAEERDHGLATADLLEDDLIVEPLLLRGGRMAAPGTPGSGAFGIRLDEDALARYAVAPA